MTSPVEIIAAHAPYTSPVRIHCECGWSSQHSYDGIDPRAEYAAHVAAALEEARREAYEVTEQWGVERGAPLTGVIPLWSKREAVGVLQGWSVRGAIGTPTLVRREILTGPWQPSASEEGR